MTIYTSKDGNKFHDKQECTNYESLLEDAKLMYSLLTKDGKEYIQENVEKCFIEYEKLISKYFPEAVKLFERVTLNDKISLNYFFGCLEVGNGDCRYTVVVTKMCFRDILYDILFHIKEAKESKTVKTNYSFKEMFNN